jgi:uncharacterized membrane protein (DUF106 family)
MAFGLTISQLVVDAPYSTLLILIVASSIALSSMIVYRLMVDVKKLQSINEETRRYNDIARQAQRSGDKVKIRRARREEVRVKMLTSYATKQRLRVTLVTVAPFALVSLLLGSIFGSSTVAISPINTPFGREIPFYIWYTLCYFASYLPLSKVFGLTMGTTMPMKSTS